MGLAFKHNGVKKQSASLYGLSGGVKKKATSAYAKVGDVKELVFLPDIIFPDGNEVFVEYFADEVDLGSVGEGVTLQTHRPVLHDSCQVGALIGWKDGWSDNNIYDPQTKALVREMASPEWDKSINWGSVFKISENHWEYHYSGMTWDDEEEEGDYYWFSDKQNLARCACVAYSEDGLNWWKPNIGRVSYNGSTENNITFDLLDNNHNANHFFYDENPSDPAYTYLLLTRPINIGQIYTSENPMLYGWTWRSELTEGGEIKSIYKQWWVRSFWFLF